MRSSFLIREENAIGHSTKTKCVTTKHTKRTQLQTFLTDLVTSD